MIEGNLIDILNKEVITTEELLKIMENYKIIKCGSSGKYQGKQWYIVNLNCCKYSIYC